MQIKEFASRLAQQHETRDPFKIAAALGFIIIETPLQGIRGYYQCVKRFTIIYIDNSLSVQERHWVCAHEIGHALLHNGLNRIFMDTHTHMVTSRYEIEADHFAVDFLYSDDDLQDLLGCSISTVACCMNVSPELAAYRMGSFARHSFI